MKPARVGKFAVIFQIAAGVQTRRDGSSLYAIRLECSPKSLSVVAEDFSIERQFPRCGVHRHQLDKIVIRQRLSVSLVDSLKVTNPVWNPLQLGHGNPSLQI